MPLSRLLHNLLPALHGAARQELYVLRKFALDHRDDGMLVGAHSLLLLLVNHHCDVGLERCAVLNATLGQVLLIRERQSVAQISLGIEAPQEFLHGGERGVRTRRVLAAVLAQALQELRGVSLRDLGFRVYSSNKGFSKGSRV